MIKKFAILSLISLFFFAASAQEYLTGLQTNPALSIKKNKNLFIRKQAIEVQLPFLDDFSYVVNVYPVDTLWENRNVFINTGYAINPPTLGVATFDAMNDTGAIYPNATTTPFIADFLTSLPIRLDSIFKGTPDNITPADSVYFSFYYQPQGVADAPSVNDSLILEFYSPHLNKWRTVWSSPGMTLAAFRAKYDSVYFKSVLIPITDTTYFQKGFQFRFKNYASIAALSLPSWQSNVDQWNIDYVYLDIERNKADSTIFDIAFVNPAPSFLKNYYSMPWSQFMVNPSIELKDTIHMTITNLNSITHISNYKYSVKQTIGGFDTISYNGGSHNIFPFINYGYQDYNYHARPPVKFPSISSTSDSAEFLITHIVKEDALDDICHQNDTTVFEQKFYNYYAYDDGTAENGYGLSGESAKLAYKFTLNQPDTLGGVQFYFNQTYNTPYYKYFYITVWSSLYPETIIYKSKRKRPEFMDSINAYYTYMIDDTSLLVSGTFYVGWKQLTDDNLNVGYDKNTNSKNNMFFNVDGTWTNSVFDGSLMIRPVMGKSWQPKRSEIIISTGDFDFEVYPNPPSDNFVHISLPGNYSNAENINNITIEVFDYLGRIILNKPYTEMLDISDLSKGMYCVRLTNYYSNEVSVKKLVISR